MHIYIYLSIYYNYKGRPKWIPLYDRRTLIDGRSHKSTWSSIFDDAAVDGSTVDDAIDQETFIARIQALAYRPCLGTYCTYSYTDDNVDDDNYFRLAYDVM